MKRSAAKQGGQSVRLKPADPFELIRWLARSQSDPRKAVAELVQNSLDAGATEVTVERVRVKGQRALVVRDNGEGVLPDRPRDDALRYLASHVGHSHKLGLSASERAERVVAGQYGIGLLGFWSIGERMELRSRVGGSQILALVMLEDSPDAKIASVPRRTDTPSTFTEVAIFPLHDAASRALAGRRLSEYLASELRGQLLAHHVKLVVRDRIARGTGRKEFTVTPRRFNGEPLKLPERVPVDGFAPLRVELYLARGAERPAIQVACAGTLVADDIADLSALALNQEPWIGCDLVGLLDFASFKVPPGSRRGVLPDAAARAFVEAVEGLRPLVNEQLEGLERQRRAAADRDVARELRKALRGLQHRLPRYELPLVRDSKPGSGAASSEPGPGHGADELPDTSEGAAAPVDAGETVPLFEPGPLATLEVIPDAITVAPGARRRVEVLGKDSAGNRLRELRVKWRLETNPDHVLAVEPHGLKALLTASEQATPGTTTTLQVDGADPRDPCCAASATAVVRIVEPRPNQDISGIPEPQLVSSPDAPWRSRLTDAVWEVNEAHPDYVALRGEPRARMRYLLALLAKEIVLYSAGRGDLAEPLESLVEVLAHAERNLGGESPRRERTESDAS